MPRCFKTHALARYHEKYIHFSNVLFFVVRGRLNAHPGVTICLGCGSKGQIQFSATGGHLSRFQPMVSCKRENWSAGARFGRLRQVTTGNVRNTAPAAFPALVARRPIWCGAPEIIEPTNRQSLLAKMRLLKSVNAPSVMQNQPMSISVTMSWF